MQKAKAFLFVCTGNLPARAQLPPRGQQREGRAIPEQPGGGSHVPRGHRLDAGSDRQRGHLSSDRGDSHLPLGTSGQRVRTVGTPRHVEGALTCWPVLLSLATS